MTPIADTLVPPTGDGTSPSWATVQRALPEAAPVDLLARTGGRRRHAEWSAEQQGERNTCIAFAVTSCIELLHAKAGEAFPRFSPQFVYWNMRNAALAPLPPDWASGSTRFSQACIVVTRLGISTWDTCRTPAINQTPLEGEPPTKKAIDEALSFRCKQLDHQDFPPGKPRDVSLASTAYKHLAAGRPVAIAVPTYDIGGGKDNWTNQDAWDTGIVRDPLPGAERSGAHAVCVVGFQPDPKQQFGGWFIFRNSRGLEWGRNAPGSGTPLVPNPGYGAISARYVEDHCWELLVLGL